MRLKILKMKNDRREVFVMFRPLPALLLMVTACPPPPGVTTPPTGPASVVEPAPTSRPTAQPAVPVTADPKFLEQYAATFRFRLGHPKSVALTPDGDQILFLRSEARDFRHDLYSFDARTGKTRVLLTTAQILKGASERLSKEERARRERMRVLSKGVVSYSLSKNGKQLLVPLSSRLFVIALPSNKVTEIRSRAKGFPIDPRLSPDGRFVACVRGGDLYISQIASGRETRLTRRPSKKVKNGLAEFVAQEEMHRFRGYWWSPDSRQIVYQQTDTSEVEVLHIMDPTHPNRPPHSWPYPRAGKKNAKVRLGIISSRGGRTRWIQWDRVRFPYLVNVKWPEGAPLTVVVQNRRQTEIAVLGVDARTGKTRELLLEKDDAWLNIDPQMPRWLPDGSGFLWTTERRGGWQLELRDKDGQLQRAITPPSLVYRKLLDVDPEAKELFVLGSQGTPTETHIFRLPLSGGGPAKQVTRDRGLHDAVFARKHRVYVQLSHLLDGRQRAVVRRRSGAAIGEIASVAESPPFSFNLELVKVRTKEQRVLHARLIRPRNSGSSRPAGALRVSRTFDDKRRYPVIVYVYGGPGYQVVTAMRRRVALWQWIADHGFIVVSIDGRGTPGRGRAWERAIKGDLISVPLADQAAGLEALGARFKELDLKRVGIFGWSFGGYFAAMAVMQRPERFHAAVAVAPVADFADYDTHYTERYLGLPSENREGYRKSSVLTFAPQLGRPLLLIHGTADDNVYFTHSIKLCDALFRAGRRYEFLPLTGLTHLVPDPLVTRRLFSRIVSFFQQQLGAASPR